MATPKQTAANRRNAQKSTGPKTAQGKQNSSNNSIKHGILARVIPEQTEGWQDLLTSLYESLRPQDELQRFLVEQIALSMLRLQRSAAWEAQTLARPAHIPLPPGRQYEGEEPPQVPASVRVPAFVASEGGQALLRYESACNRQIKRNLELLLKLQPAKRLKDKPACPYLEQMEGAAPSAPPLPSCPADTTATAASEPGPSGPGHPSDAPYDLPSAGFSLSRAPSPLEGEGRMPAPIASGPAPENSGEGRYNELHTVSDNELASFRNSQELDVVGAGLISVQTNRRAETSPALTCEAKGA